MKAAAITSFVLMASLSGCASIVNGVNQSVSVESRSEGATVAGAACKLSSNKGVWFVTTPGTVTIHRGFQDLAVECTRLGFTPAISSVPSRVKPMAFGNILFGGVIGVIVDSGDGAAFDYPDLISIDLGSPTSGAPTAAAAIPSSVSDAPSAPSVTAAPVTSFEQPVANARVAPLDTRETKYQVSAENLAKTRACNANPFAKLTARGPGSETYAIPCTSGDAMIVRCEFGNCRALQ